MRVMRSGDVIKKGPRNRSGFTTCSNVQQVPRAKCKTNREEDSGVSLVCKGDILLEYFSLVLVKKRWEGNRNVQKTMIIGSR